MEKQIFEIGVQMLKKSWIGGEGGGRLDLTLCEFSRIELLGGVSVLVQLCFLSLDHQVLLL